MGRTVGKNKIPVLPIFILSGRHAGDKNIMNRKKIFVRLFLIGFLLICSIATLPTQISRTEVSAQAKNEISVSNSKFEPKKLTVPVGTTVTWSNTEGVHTVKSDTDAFVSKTLSAGDKFSYEFTKPGTYPYHCTFHGSSDGHGMAGTIVVTKKK
jgi:plastocyanin